MSTDEERDPLVAFALRWWWLLAIGVVLGIVGAVAYTKYGPTTYSSTALVQVPAQTSTDPTANAGQARSATANYAAAGTSTHMYELVSQKLVGMLDLSPTDLQKMAQAGEVKISPESGANFFSVDVINKDPQAAELLANTFADIMVQDINERVKAQYDARQAQLQQQIDFTRQQLTVAQLFQTKRDLDQTLSSQRSTLIALQASRQQELARVTTPDVPAQTQSDVQDILDAQIKDVQDNIASTASELSNVQQSIDQLPPGTDPLLSSSYASAYSSQLAGLTNQAVGEQLAALTAAPPLVKFGDATDPISTGGLKKALFLGVVAGGSLFAGLSYLLDLLLRRRQQRESVDMLGRRSEIEELLRTLEGLDLVEDHDVRREAQPIRGRPAP